jgi:hypothetical protein
VTEESIPDDPSGERGEWWERDLRQKIDDLEEKKHDIVFDLEFSIALARLKDHPGWQRLVDRMQQLIAEKTIVLQTQELRPYRQGKIQGIIYAIGKMLRQRTLSVEEIEALQLQGRMLNEQIAAHRQELER